MTDNNYTVFAISFLDEGLVLDIWCNAWTFSISHHNAVNILWSRCAIYHKLFFPRCAIKKVYAQELLSGIQKKWDEVRRGGMRWEVVGRHRRRRREELRQHLKRNEMRLEDLKRGHHKGRQSWDEMACDEVWSGEHEECNVKGEVREVWGVKSEESVRL